MKINYTSLVKHEIVSKYIVFTLNEINWKFKIMNRETKSEAFFILVLMDRLITAAIISKKVRPRFAASRLLPRMVYISNSFHP